MSDPTTSSASPASQRTGGFRGGVQAGTSATTTWSRAIEKIVREVAAELRTFHPDLVWRPGFTGTELGRAFGLPANLSLLPGMQPDGGIWVHRASGKPVLFVEAKKQGKSGNAIERWYKNRDDAQALNPKALYVTFCYGEGFFDGNSAERTLFGAVAKDGDGPDRIRRGAVWNIAEGLTRLYRFRDEPADMRDTVKAALQQALTDAANAQSGASSNGSAA